ncbi:Origin recognition complex subunit 1 OS=Schizosaccharomyces pombe (strain 972 / ATCC 24843) GN=orc1 PE=1 SV=1 [Rhizoctonia solani AG-1 IB]|uniref:Origin recognition complex subunit 1 n=1 Tax=Thanatephorus cucumeris (strain AG1-IB / isolate 7/3/14) TaxID=1108050 RepID=A0A0B7FXB5_THACB|nr:Origin recognition complex subunit 1 OS=Schizosaccharomyces pombe (strain 972 / ATCC 24843) GN=orc1 PE=1 SV=1 [Rhizoctonia solani AG-1 IB]
MWYISAPGRLDSADDDDFLDETRMYILAHKFLRPAIDLPKIRSQRPYRKKEVYYAVNRESSSIKLRVNPSAILRRCTISSDPSRFPTLCLTEAQWAKTEPLMEEPLSQNNPPVTPSRRNRPSRTATQQTDAAYDFLCLSAHDAQLGIYYDFAWDIFRKQALKLSDPSIDFQDLNGDGWNLRVDKPLPINSRARATATPKAKTSDKTPRASKQRQSAPKASKSISTGPTGPTTPTRPTSRQQRQLPSTIYKDEPESDSDSSSSAGGSDVYEPILDEPEEPDNLEGDVLEPDELGDEEDPVTDEDDEGIPQTPRKAQLGSASPAKRGRGRPRKDAGEPKTPSRQRTKGIAAPTPHSKAALRKRRSAIDLSRLRGVSNTDEDPSLGVAASSLPDTVGSDPHVRAMYALHVGARPGALPCRDNELIRVLGDVADLVTSGVGGCIYISGLPGTGKTATVHAVIRELKGMAMRNEISPFSYVEINGLRIPEPSAAYALLWEAISGHDAAQHGHLNISSKEALRRLTRHFNSRTSAGSHTCVVLMDELDQMVTTKQDVVYNFFNWPNLPDSNLVVIAVANTHDLPERTMSAKVRSRLGMERINFEPYTVQQLVEIVNARLGVARAGQPDHLPVMKPDAVNFAARKVASIFGDARRVLDVCRRAVEVCHNSQGSRTVTIQDVVEVIKSMDKSSTADYIRDCSFHERLLLASMVSRMRRAGVDSVKWDDVITYHMSQSVMLGKHKPTRTELRAVLDSLVLSRAVIAEDSSQVAEGDRLVALKLERDAVERVLCADDLGGEKWKSILGL